jgi:hypothetical protein
MAENGLRSEQEILMLRSLLRLYAWKISLSTKARQVGLLSYTAPRLRHPDCQWYQPPSSHVPSKPVRRQNISDSRRLYLREGLAHLLCRFRLRLLADEASSLFDGFQFDSYPLFENGRGDVPVFVEVGEAGIVADNVMRHRRWLQPVG